MHTISGSYKTKVKILASHGNSYYTIYNAINSIDVRYHLTIRDIREILTGEEPQLYYKNFLGWEMRRDPSDILNDQEKDALMKFYTLNTDKLVNVPSEMGYPDYIVNSLYAKMKKEIDEFNKSKVIEEEISSMYYAEWTPEQIHEKYRALSIKDINYIIDHKLRMRARFDECINVYKLEKFKRFDLNIGDKFILYSYQHGESYEPNRFIRVKKVATVKKFYPFIVETSIGYYPYIDLYTADRTS